MTRKGRKLLTISDNDIKVLKAFSVSRTEPSAKVQRSRIIMDYSLGLSIAKIVRKYNTNRPLVERTIDKALAFGPLTALNDLPVRRLHLQRRTIFGSICCFCRPLSEE